MYRAQILKHVACNRDSHLYVKIQHSRSKHKQLKLIRGNAAQSESKHRKSLFWHQKIMSRIDH
jgi:hypothetical protein